MPESWSPKSKEIVYSVGFATQLIICVKGIAARVIKCNVFLETVSSLNVCLLVCCTACL